MKNILIGLLLLTSFYSCQKAQGKETEIAKDSTLARVKAPVPVEVLELTQKEVSYRISSSSTAYGNREGYVSSVTAGIVTGVYFNIGQYVKKGQKLVTIDDRIQKVNFDQAQSVLESAKHTFEATKKLYESGNASESEMKGVDVQYKQAITAFASANKALSDCTVRAPFSGYIASRDKNLEVGSNMAPGSIVTRLVDISSLKSTFFVSEDELAFLKKGLEVDLEVIALQEKFKGKIISISPAADPMTGSFAVDVSFKNNKDTSVKSGMTLSVEFNSLSNEMVNVVPLNLIQDFEGKKGVFVSENSRATVIPVSLGRNIGNLVEVKSMKSGAQIISSGYTTIESGDSLIVNVIGKTGDEK